MKLSTSVRRCLANALKKLVHKVSTALLDTNPSRKQDTIIPSLKRGYLSLLFLDCPLIPITRVCGQWTPPFCVYSHRARPFFDARHFADPLGALTDTNAA